MLPITTSAILASLLAGLAHGSPVSAASSNLDAINNGVSVGASLIARSPSAWDDLNTILGGGHHKHDDDNDDDDDNNDHQDHHNENNNNGHGRPKPTHTKPASTKPATPTTTSTSISGSKPGSLWKPQVGTPWQIILRNTVNANVESLTPDVSVWDIDVNEHPDAMIELLHSQGKKVICYFSAGSWEDWRADKDKFKPEDLGNVLDGWPNEKWLKTDSPNVRAIMSQRIATAAAKKCDAIDPDNVDGFQNNNGLGLTKEGAVDYMKFLSAEARKYNMAIGLKNAGDIIDDVLDYVDFSVNEQCAQYSECGLFAKFIKAGKPVFQIEYPNEKKRGVAPRDMTPAAEKACRSMEAASLWGFSTVIKNLDLGGWVQYCDGKTYDTPTV
ncbi:hypothetical protein VHEMI08772 [[Torrubiella] hemipterigena]|uniref:alpha-galactosidase n=1 Tax=[Torrubiella] hemipterigena TaxID=1531966 RepID=A0A0A1TP68_9HYPO|nr:hypothetical protein VHEMI08772 [[Torrubiella] hemipterigena]